MTALDTRHPTPDAPAKATRQSFGEALAELGAAHPEICVLDADLSCSTKSALFAQRFPERFFQMGIAEANMIGTGAGLALSGKTVYLCSFACFVTGRYDIVRMSVAFAEANVRIVGTHAGIGVGPDGNSQMGLEDLALMRALPTMSVCQPADDRETRQLLEYSVRHRGPMYLRLTRHNLPPVHGPEYRFAFGKADQLRDGTDLCLVASGATVAPALQAAARLAARGIEARVLNIHTLRPLDTEALARAARECGRLVTVEDHSITGGLGGAVAEALGETQPAPLLRLGLHGFGESGETADLYRKYRLDAAGIAADVAAWAP